MSGELIFDMCPTFIDYCLNETVGSVEAYGIFTWPKTAVGKTSSLPCPYNKENSTSRECRYSNETKGSVWSQIDVQKCTFKDERSKGLFLLAQVVKNFKEYYLKY